MPATRTSAYIIHRPSGYYFRYTVPADLRGLVGRREFKMSLKTSSKHAARKRAYHLLSAVHRCLDLTRRFTVTKLTQEQLRSIINTQIKAALEDYEEAQLRSPFSVAVMNHVPCREQVLDCRQLVKELCGHPISEQLAGSPDMIRHTGSHRWSHQTPLARRPSSARRFRGWQPFLQARMR